MSASFSFGGISSSAKKQILNLKVIDDIVILDTSHRREASYNFPIVILVDEHYSKFQLQAIQMFLESCRIPRFKIITALNCIATKDIIKSEQRDGIIDFYRNNSSAFWKEIPAGAVIVTVGAALYAVTRSDHIYPSDVQQRIFGKSYFWYSRNQSEDGHWVYPIDSFKDIFADGFASMPVDSFKTKLARMQLEAIRTRKDSLAPYIRPIKLVDIRTTEEFDAWYNENKHRNGELLAWDLETSGFSFRKDRIGCFTCSFDGSTGYYIKWNVIDKRKLNHILANNIQLGANLKFDIKFLWQQGVTAARVDEDVVVLGHVLDETRSNSLKALAYYYTPYGGYDLELDDYVRKTKVNNYLEIPEPLLKKYAAMDAVVTWQVYDNMIKHCRLLDKKYPNEKGTNWSMEDYYRKIRIPAVNMYAKIEYRGVYVNKARLDAVRIKVRKRIDELQQQLAKLFDVPVSFNFCEGMTDDTSVFVDSFGGETKEFDFGSNELAKLLEKKGWECLGRQKNGTYQCSDFQLARWAKTHKEAELIQELRSCKVVLNTFIGDEAGTKGWSQYLEYHDEDKSWRMHPNFNAMGTESGRSRCSNPNMQNVPTHGVFAREVKECLSVPNDDYYMVTIDFSALQLRLAAIDGDDDVLCRLFKEHPKNADIHSKTAYGLFVKGKPWTVETITVEQNGKKYVFLGGQIVNTQNRGEIFAKDLREDDTLLV